MNFHSIPKRLSPEILRSLLGVTGGWVHSQSLSHAFTLIGVECVADNKPKWAHVECDRVASRNWNQNRFESVREAYKNKVELPPIEIVCLMWRGEPFFSLTDGNHRTEAAKAMGLKTIFACIHEVMVCDESAFYIHGLRLHALDGGDMGLIDPVAARLLGALGVKRKGSIIKWFRDWRNLCKQRRAMMVVADDLIEGGVNRSRSVSVFPSQFSAVYCLGK